MVQSEVPRTHASPEADCHYLRFFQGAFITMANERFGEQRYQKIGGFRFSKLSNSSHRIQIHLHRASHWLKRGCSVCRVHRRGPSH
jgi:hypothetical protein